MSKSKKAIVAAVLGSVLILPLSLTAQQADDDEAEAWRALDTDFRQAIIDEIMARRGLAGHIDNADELVKSAEDIQEALLVSCELSGACADEAGRATLGEQLRSLPAYDELEGLRNSHLILRMKSGSEN